jgi:hypothetical protein
VLLFCFVTSKTDYIPQANQNFVNQAGLAQSVERRTLNPVVEGSSPSFGATFLHFFFPKVGRVFFPPRILGFMALRNKEYRATWWSKPVFYIPAHR